MTEVVLGMRLRPAQCLVAWIVLDLEAAAALGAAKAQA